MYLGKINIQNVLCDEKGAEKSFIARHYAQILLENKSFEQSSFIAQEIYNKHINNIINICKVYNYNYVNKDFILNNSFYRLNTYKEKVFISKDILEDPKLPQIDKDLSFNIFNSVNNSKKVLFFQPAIAVFNCKNLHKTYKETPLIIDGVHRCLATCDMIKNGYDANLLLVILSENSHKNYCKLNIPKFLYDRIKIFNPIITLNSSSINCINIEKEYNIDNDIWYEVNVRHVELIYGILLFMCFMIDIFHKENENNTLNLIPSNIVNNIYDLKEGNFYEI